jgi:hypothetical protein
LVLVVGPSGAGKDTLLGLAKAACADDGNVVFPRRVITREASASEENEEVSIGTFQEALTRGEYAMHWEAHGHCYALPRAIDDEIRIGRTIVANAGRVAMMRSGIGWLNGALPSAATLRIMPGLIMANWTLPAATSWIVDGLSLPKSVNGQSSAPCSRRLMRA